MHLSSWISRLFHGPAALRALLLAALLTACGVPIDVPLDETPEPFPSGTSTEPSPVATQEVERPPTAAALRTPLPAPTVIATTPPGDTTSAACGYETDPAATPGPGSRRDLSSRESPSGRLIAPTGVRPAELFETSPLVREPGLETAVNEALGADRERYAVVVQDLSTGRGATVNADRVFYAASVFKLTVMYEVFNQIAQGLLSLEDEVVVTPYYEAFGLGPRTTALCDRLTIDAALRAMMGVSDNAVAVLLQDLVGSNAINASMEALGLAETRLLPEDLPLTAADVAILLDGIAHGEAVSNESSTQMLRLMAGEQIDNGMKSGVPSGTLVAHKTGNWSNATHDVGIVYAPNATYMLVVLSETNHESRVIRAVSQAVYEYFESNP